MKRGATRKLIKKNDQTKLDQTRRKEKMFTKIEACKSQTLGIKESLWKKRIQGKPNQNTSPKMLGKHKTTKHDKKQIKFMLSFVIVCHRFSLLPQSTTCPPVVQDFLEPITWDFESHSAVGRLLATYRHVVKRIKQTASRLMFMQ